MSRRIVLGIMVWALAGAVGCSGDDDGSGAGGGGSGAGDDGSSGDGSGTGSGDAGDGSGTGSGAGNGSSGSGSGSGTSGSGSGDSGTGGSGAGAGTTGGGAGTGAFAGSGGLDLPLTQCTDGMDNDGDGTMDGFDIECTGPYDDDEASFATGISGDNVDPKWQDCFFDGNSGAGNDGCRYSTDCLTGDLPQSDSDCQVTQMCLDFCMPSAPPGCDCFGCCTVATADGPQDVIIGVDCDIDVIDSCTTCVKSAQCENECGECELCTGVTVNDLPDDCFEKYPPTAGSGGSGSSGSGGSGSSGTGGSGSSGTGGSGSSGTGGSGSSGTGGSGGTGGPPPGYTCDNNAQLCRDQTECPPGYYCSFGCCKVIPPI